MRIRIFKYRDQDMTDREKVILFLGFAVGYVAGSLFTILVLVF